MIDLSNATRADCVDAIEQAQLAKHEAHLAIDDLEGDDEKRERLLLLIIDTLDDMSEARHRIDVLDAEERAMLTRQVEVLRAKIDQPKKSIDRSQNHRIMRHVKPIWGSKRILSALHEHSQKRCDVSLRA